MKHLSGLLVRQKIVQTLKFRSNMHSDGWKNYLWFEVIKKSFVGAKPINLNGLHYDEMSWLSLVDLLKGDNGPI